MMKCSARFVQTVKTSLVHVATFKIMVSYIDIRPMILIWIMAHDQKFQGWRKFDSIVKWCIFINLEMMKGKFNIGGT